MHIKRNSRWSKNNIIDTVHTGGLQSFDKYKKVNPIKIKTDGNWILETSQRYQNGSNFLFIVDGLLSSSCITNEANVLFITCSGLNNAYNYLVNSKSFV